jgi:hypothetical protein
MSDITVFYFADDITLLYSLYPLLLSKLRKRFFFTKDLDYVLKRDRRRSLIVVRFMKRDDIADQVGLFSRLREKYDRVVYFDDTADPRELKAELLPYVDRYFKKQVLRDRSHYLRPVYGKRLYTEYYHERHGAVDDKEVILPPVGAAEAEKIALSWNLGIGSYPKSRIRKGLAVRAEAALGVRFIRPFLNNPLSYRPGLPTRNQVSARFGTKFDRETVAMHRRIFQDLAKGRPDLFLTGRVPLKEFNRELREVRAVLSPFGWGEICFRDFEAVLNRSVLIKPSMDHIETWPDVYRAGKTYVSVDWEGSDLIDKTQAVLNDEEGRRALTEEALAVLLDAYRNIEPRVENLVRECTV